MVLGNREKKKCIPPTNLFSCRDKTQLSGQMFSRVILIEPSSESFVSAYSPHHLLCRNFSSSPANSENWGASFWFMGFRHESLYWQPAVGTVRWREVTGKPANWPRMWACEGVPVLPPLTWGPADSGGYSPSWNGMERWAPSGMKLLSVPSLDTLLSAALTTAVSVSTPVNYNQRRGHNES